MAFWNGRRVLITGVNGFVGSNLAMHLLEQGAEITGLERNLDRRSMLHFEGAATAIRFVNGDLIDRSFIERVLSEGDFEICFHLAAQVEIGVGMLSPYSTFETNIRGTYTLLDGLRTHAPSLAAVIVASTDKAYGEYPASAMPYRETYPLQPKYPYDTSKACADMIARAYGNEIYRLPVIVTRFCNIYGPGQLNFSALVPDASRAALGLGRFIPRGDGSHVRDFIFSSDVARLYSMIAETAVHDPERYRGAIYNAGTNEPRTVREVIEMIFRNCDNEAALHEIVDAMKHAKTSGEISVQYMDFDVVERDFGWRPVTPFTDGISETIEWYRRYLTAVRE